MLKVMGATAVGAAVSGTGIESALAAAPSPSHRGMLGMRPGSAAIAGPKIPHAGSPTPFTTYTSYPGSDFDAGASSLTWNVSGFGKAPTNGGFYVRRLDLPNNAVITECIFYLVNPTTNISCYLFTDVINVNSPTQFGIGTTSAPSATPQLLVLTVTPTQVVNIANAYEMDFETGGATDTEILSARVGWLNEPGMTLFPNPRRIVNGFATPFTSGGLYGPFDATLESDGVTATGIPAGATAAFCAVMSYSPGVLTLYPDGTPDTHIGNYSGTGNLGSGLNMTYMMVPLGNAGKFRIHSYITGKCFVDAWGYVI
jgi:hypothetical protein